MSRVGGYTVSDEDKIREVSREFVEMFYVRAPIYIQIRRKDAFLENRHVRKSGTYVLVAESLKNSVQFDELRSQLGWDHDGRLLHDF